MINKNKKMARSNQALSSRFYNLPHVHVVVQQICSKSHFWHLSCMPKFNLVVGVGYRWVIFCIIFGTVFVVFHSTSLNMKWQNFRPWVQEKSVQRPHMSPYLDMMWKWFGLQNPSSKPFNGKLLWIWCLNTCKWVQNTYFWKFHENWTLRFLKNWHFGSKLSARALFKIFFATRGGR